jgi:hypothetical protein
MSLDREYGTHLELQAFCDLHSCCVAVYSDATPEYPPTLVGLESSPRMLEVAFLRGNHYNAGDAGIFCKYLFLKTKKWFLWTSLTRSKEKVVIGEGMLECANVLFVGRNWKMWICTLQWNMRKCLGRRKNESNINANNIILRIG